MSKEKIDNSEIKYEKEKKIRFKALKSSIKALLVFTLLCGLIYPFCVTIVAQTVYPYEANGSQIVVTLEDGTQRVFGSELIGQQYEQPKYLFGRVNIGVTNLSPESDEYNDLIETRVNERKEKLKAIGYDESVVPAELVTSSGSGVDPHISVETAYYQIPIIVAARQALGQDISEEKVREIIDKYTEGRFLGIFGNEHVNVLLVNLALDGVL